MRDADVCSAIAVDRLLAGTSMCGLRAVGIDVSERMPKEVGTRRESQLLLDYSDRKSMDERTSQM